MEFIHKFINKDYLFSYGLFGLSFYLYYYKINYSTIGKYFNDNVKNKIITHYPFTNDSVDFNLLDEIRNEDTICEYSNGESLNSENSKLNLNNYPIKSLSDKEQYNIYENFFDENFDYFYYCYNN